MADEHLPREPSDAKTGDEPMTDAQEGETGTPPHPSPADGGSPEATERPPRPSQAEGER